MDHLRIKIQRLVIFSSLALPILCGAVGDFAANRCNQPVKQVNHGILTFRDGINGNGTYNTTVTLNCSEGYKRIGPGQLRCADKNKWQGILGICLVKRCNEPVKQVSHGTLRVKNGIDGKRTYNSTVTLNCNKGYKRSGDGQVRCADENEWQGTLGICLAKRCNQPVTQVDHGILTFRDGINGNGTYNTTVTLNCNEGYKRSRVGQLRCADEDRWQGTLGICMAKRCNQPVTQVDHGILTFRYGINGNGTYNTTVTLNCNEGYKSSRIGQLRCADEDRWQGTLGICMDIDECTQAGICHYHGQCFNTDGSFVCNCSAGYNGITCENVTRCTEIVPPEYGVIVVEPGTEGRWSFNTTVAIICNTGYSPNGETLSKCLETGRWTNALGYCLALQEKHADEEASKTCLLGWVINGPLCLILLVTNIATCLRFRRHQSFKSKKRNSIPDDVTTAIKVNASSLRLQAKEGYPAYDFVEDSNVETLKNEANQSENNVMEPYDNIQMENKENSEYDELTFERESFLKTTTKNEI